MPPNRAIHEWTLCGGIYISQRAFTAFLFRIGLKFTRFRTTKTSANKRFYNMSAKSIAKLCAAKLQHFFELSKSLYRKECLSLRYGFGIPSGKSERPHRMYQCDRKRTERILRHDAPMRLGANKQRRILIGALKNERGVHKVN